MRLRLAHYRNRFSMFRTYYALRAGLVRADGLEFTILELPDPPSRELEAALIRGDVDLANLYLPNFLERRLEGAPLIGLCTEWESTGKGNGLFVRRNGIRDPADLEGGRVVVWTLRGGAVGGRGSEILKSWLGRLQVPYFSTREFVDASSNAQFLRRPDRITGRA